jgi:alpha-mannosidase
MQSWAVMPTIEFSTYHKFFEELESYKDKIAVVEEELNFVFTGCYTSQSRIKMANRIAEARLFESEVICTAANLLGNNDYGKQFGTAWENVLYNHFHDIIPGSGVTETREHALGLFQKTLAHAYANSSNALRYLAANIDTSSAKSLYSQDIKETVSEGAGVGFGVADSTFGTFNYLIPRTERGAGDARIFHLFNPTQYHRKEAATVIIWDWQYTPHRALFTDTDGNTVKSKFLHRGNYWAHNYFIYAISCDIPPFSYKTYVLDQDKPKNYRFSSTSDPRNEAVKDNKIILENDLVYAEFDRRTLKLISYKDKQANRQLINAPSAYFRYISEDHRSSAWVIGSYMKISDLHEDYNVRLLISEVDNGGLVSRFTYEIEFLASHLNVTVILKENSRVLEFLTEIDWREQSNDRITPQIGFFAPLGYAVANYRYDIPFGTIERAGVNDDRPANTFVAAIPENANCGAVAVINDTRYGYRCVDDSIYLNLLHTSKSPDQHPETDKHTIKIGLLASENCDNTTFYKEASAFLHPLAYVTNKPHSGKLPYNSGTLFTVEGKIKISAVKTPEDEGDKNKNIMIIRLYDISGENGKVSLKFASGIQKVASLNLNEVPLQPELSAASNLTVNGSTLSFDLIKYGVATIKVQF